MVESDEATQQGWAGVERGSAMPVLVVCMLLACALMFAVGRLGAAATERARAQTAADAAALAGAADGRDAADAFARTNGGAVVRYLVDNDDVEVVVRVGSAVATARARRGCVNVIANTIGRCAAPGD